MDSKSSLPPASPSRSASGPVPLGHRSNRQSASEGELLPPRAPGMHSKQSSASIDSLSDASSIASSSRKPLRRLSKLPNTLEVPSAIDRLEEAVIAQSSVPQTRHETSNETLRQPVQPPQHSHSEPTPLSTKVHTSYTTPSPKVTILNQSNDLTTSPITRPGISPKTPSAASLVHPALRPRQPSITPSTFSASSLVHPSQRLRSTSNSVTLPLSTFPTSVTPISVARTPAPPAQVETLVVESPVEIKPPSPSLTPSPALVTPTAPAPEAPPLPPSSYSDLLPAAVKAARRRSADFGTYDIHAARRERENLIATGARTDNPHSLKVEKLPSSPSVSPNVSKDKELPTLPPPEDVDAKPPIPRRSPNCLSQVFVPSIPSVYDPSSQDLATSPRSGKATETRPVAQAQPPKTKPVRHSCVKSVVRINDTLHV